MILDTDTLDAMAAVLAYPHFDYPERLSRLRAVLAAAPGDPDARDRAGELLDRFMAATSGFGVAEYEELYTRTFDINPIASLEVGWHLFGETYERGAFMVAMREQLRHCGVEESAELPDHITHVLAAVGRMPADVAYRLVSPRIQMAVEKMLAGFEGKDNPYRDVMAALNEMITERTPIHAGSEES